MDTTCTLKRGITKKGTFYIYMVQLVEILFPLFSSRLFALNREPLHIIYVHLFYSVSLNDLSKSPGVKLVIKQYTCMYYKLHVWSSKYVVQSISGKSTITDFTQSESWQNKVSCIKSMKAITQWITDPKSIEI